jgi:aerobic C4-dicarboxylate transport protein
MRLLGCSESTVGVVIPTGYSFNLDGTNIYMTMAAIFLAQATNHSLTITQQITLLLVAMISSKGASGVTGAGFITLAATLASVRNPDGTNLIPVESMALLLGNGVATVVVSRWEKEITPEQLQKNLREPHSLTEVTPHPVPVEADAA